MRKFIIIFLICYTSALYCQIDTTKTVYKNLEVKKFYSGGGEMLTQKGETKYFVAGKKTTKRKYEKFSEAWNNMETCKPCILKTYDQNDVLLYQAVACTDARVGQYIEYYKNGKIKTIGHYKENPTNNWDNLCKNGYCSVKHGTWTYYKPDGSIEKLEIFKNDTLIKP